MKLFLQRLAVFGIVFVLLNTLAQRFVSPHYGNDCYRAKLEHFREHAGEYDTVFLGSSKTYRHVIPAELDRALAHRKTSSFNLGSPASFNPEIYYLLEHFLAETPPSLRSVVVELQPLGVIDGRNINTPRSYYWHDPRHLAFALRYVAASRHRFERKWNLVRGYCASLALKHLSFLQYEALKGAPPQVARAWLGTDQRGFVSLDEELERGVEGGSVRGRHQDLLDDPGILDSKFAAALEDFSAADHSADLNQPHLQKLEQLLELAQAKGVRLVFVIPPLMSDYRELLALKERLPEGTVIEIASRAKHPELYRAEVAFDIGHLNREGARLFTARLASELDRALGAGPAPGVTDK